MLMVKQIHKRTPQEKERIILDIQTLGVIAGCCKYGISKTLYYYWVDKYQASGLEGLEDRRGKNMNAHVKRLEKENRNQVAEACSYIARVIGTRTYPWRIFAVAGDEKIGLE